jgi:hypothetical protein
MQACVSATKEKSNLLTRAKVKAQAAVTLRVLFSKSNRWNAPEKGSGWDVRRSCQLVERNCLMQCFYRCEHHLLQLHEILFIIIYSERPVGWSDMFPKPPKIGIYISVPRSRRSGVVPVM